MTISCQLKSHDGPPIEGVFVELKCMDFPEQHFSGLSDNSGMIDEWISVRDQKAQCVQGTPNMDGSHLNMRFHVQPLFGEMFPGTWNTIWVPQQENSHVVFHVYGDMYAIIKNGPSHVETPRNGSRNLTFSFGSCGLKDNNSSGLHPLVLNFGTSGPYDRSCGLKRKATRSEVTDEAPQQEGSKRQRDMSQPQQLMRSARLAKP
ncbi:hypothetical protein MHUMG1_08900 [Metarhizium humberi]|uniref:Uncharacterized protein n=1 Tax=Metarhizium humberi TaxID=2596975 RepID=A0A9P8M3V5_9HYPO|nr:hypothetical protein MHUMG1_08900 [Metarhizium humberi]